MKLAALLLVLVALASLGWLALGRAARDAPGVPVTATATDEVERASVREARGDEQDTGSQSTSRSATRETTKNRFAVQVRTRKRGSVRNAPASGLRVEIEAKSDDCEPFVIAEGVTNATGFFDVDIPWSAVANLAGTSGALLSARVVSAGYQERSQVRAMPKEIPPFDSVMMFKLNALEGVTLRGTILDTVGDPTTGIIQGECFRIGYGLALE